MVQLTGFINFSAENRNSQFLHMDGCAPCRKNILFMARLESAYSLIQVPMEFGDRALALLW